MKKPLIALAILGAFAGAASAQNNVSIYGIVDAGITYTDNGKGNGKIWGLDSGGQSSSRIGFKGSEDLGGGLSAIFTLENGFKLDDGKLGSSDRLFDRQAWVGLSGGFGTVKLGRQYIPLRSALESVDPFAYSLAGNLTNMFEDYDERANNTLSYATPNLSGFSAQAAYSFGEVAGSTSTGRNTGFSVGYANGPINLVLARHDKNLVTSTNAPDGKADTTMVGGTYDFGLAKVHAAYAQNKGKTEAGVENVDSRDMMLGLSAPVGTGAIMASFVRRDNKLKDNADADMWALGYTYPLSKRTNLYTSYAHVKNDANSSHGGVSTVAGGDTSKFNVGIRHRF